MTRFWDVLLAVWDKAGYKACDSGNLISSGIRYEIWNLIRGTLLGVLDEMWHDSGKVPLPPYIPSCLLSRSVSQFLSFSPSFSLTFSDRKRWIDREAVEHQGPLLSVIH